MRAIAVVNSWACARHPSGVLPAVSPYRSGVGLVAPSGGAVLPVDATQERGLPDRCSECEMTRLRVFDGWLREMAGTPPS
jgi:hypothetical protein